MGAISQTNVNFVGSHCGVSIGEDGASQMALEDISMFRSIPGSTVFYPADAVATERAVELAANTKGICFIRVNRPTTNVIYPNDHVFEVCLKKKSKWCVADFFFWVLGWKGVCCKEIEQRSGVGYCWWCNFTRKFNGGK